MLSDVNSPGHRLENIKSVQPYIEALKTISLSKWKTSVNRRQRLNDQIVELETSYQIIRSLVENLPSTHPDNRTIVIIGTDQGFCGSLNQNIFHHFIQDIFNDSVQRRSLFVIGRKLRKLFSENQMEISSFPAVQNNPIRNIEILNDFIQENVIPKNSSLETLSFNYFGAGQGQIELTPIIPFSLPLLKELPEPTNYIIDTDEKNLIKYLSKRLSILYFYRVYLTALAYENSLRYQNMENASRNAEDLIDELQTEVQAYRRQKITSEIRELAISAGLLKKE